MIKFRLLLIALLSIVLVSCGGDSDQSSDFPVSDVSQEKAAFYAANPDRFRFKTLADLPVDLDWENGMELPEIGSTQAVKGGTQYSIITDFPPTLRPYGPDATARFVAGYTTILA